MTLSPLPFSRRCCWQWRTVSNTVFKRRSRAARWGSDSSGATLWRGSWESEARMTSLRKCWGRDRRCRRSHVERRILWIEEKRVSGMGNAQWRCLIITTDSFYVVIIGASMRFLNSSHQALFGNKYEWMILFFSKRYSIWSKKRNSTKLK